MVLMPLEHPPYDIEQDWVALLRRNEEETVVPITDLAISPTQISLEAGEDGFLHAAFSPANATIPNLIWSSNDPLICTVDTNGKINALSEGTATITVHTEDLKFSASALVEVKLPTEVNVINDFKLINAETNTELMNLQDGQIIDLKAIEQLQLSIQANTFPTEVGSVFMKLSGPMNKERTENVAPYTLFGNHGGQYVGANLVAGNYILTATAYSGEDKSGEPGPGRTIYFTIRDTSPEPNFTIVDIGTETALFSLEDQMVIHWEALYNKSVNIVAHMDTTKVSSVYFKLQGPVETEQIENGAPFTLFGEHSGNYLGQELPAGNYRLLTRTYSGQNLSGEPIDDASLAFSIEHPATDIDKIYSVNLNGDIKQNPNDNKKTRLSLHPNPASNHFKADLLNTTKAITSVFIYDMSGSLVYKQNTLPNLNSTNQSKQINTTSLTPGIYLVKVFTEAYETYHYKLIVDAK